MWSVLNQCQVKFHEQVNCLKLFFHWNHTRLKAWHVWLSAMWILKQCKVILKFFFILKNIIPIYSNHIYHLFSSSFPRRPPSSSMPPSLFFFYISLSPISITAVVMGSPPGGHILKEEQFPLPSCSQLQKAVFPRTPPISCLPPLPPWSLHLPVGVML